jgi:hypothetical protein
LNTDKTVYVIGQLANHSIRDVLELSRSLINSPHVGLDEAFKAYVLGSALHIQDFKIRRALIRGRYDIAVTESSKFLHNIFELNSELETTPLLGLRILQALKDGVVMSGDTNTRYTSRQDLFNYMLAMGLERRAVHLWLDALLKKALVLNYDPTKIDAESATQLEISPSGELHLYWGRGNYDYLEAMAEITTILDRSSFDSLESVSQGQGKRRAQQMLYVFVEYLRGEDRVFCRPPDHESYHGQHQIAFRLGN